MKRARPQHWLALFVWLLLALLAQSALGGRWMPDLCLVLLISLAARMEEREAALAALLAAFVRASFTGEGWIVAGAGLLGAVLLVLSVRSFLEVSAPLYASLMMFALVFAVSGFGWLAAAARAYWAQAGSVAGPASAAWAQVALSSAGLAALACWIVPRLPGLSPLVSRKW
ncbi:MAG: hypothetical protein RL277_1420 [Planctomycetota bacterium]|jgi:hypothetical protein